MKVRESGMPEEDMWSEFFDPDAILQHMGYSFGFDSVVDLGCGFGTFTIPAAKKIDGTLHAFDIDPDMINRLQNKINIHQIKNNQVFTRFGVLNYPNLFINLG